MSLRRGRVLPGSTPMVSVELAPTIPLDTAQGARTIPRGHVVGREVVDVSVEAARIIEKAEKEAAHIRELARAEIQSLKDQSRTEALEEASARLAAHWIALRQREALADEKNIERCVALARIMAERLLGQTLATHPDAVVSLARETMLPLRRARRITVYANDDHAEVLRAHLEHLPVSPDVAEVVTDPSLARGDLRLESDLGTLDASLGPQLDRLAEVIRRELEHQSK